MEMLITLFHHQSRLKHQIDFILKKEKFRKA